MGSSGSLANYVSMIFSLAAHPMKKPTKWSLQVHTICDLSRGFAGPELVVGSLPIFCDIQI